MGTASGCGQEVACDGRCVTVDTDAFTILSSLAGTIATVSDDSDSLRVRRGISHDATATTRDDRQELTAAQSRQSSLQACQLSLCFRFHCVFDFLLLTHVPMNKYTIARCSSLLDSSRQLRRWSIVQIHKSNSSMPRHLRWAHDPGPTFF